MKTEQLSIHISESLGSVSAELMHDQEVKCLFVFAHGAGAGMQHPFMVRLASELAASGIATLRYNFPYMEKHRRRPDPPAIAEKTVNQAIARASSLFPTIPIFAGGKSFGGRMTSQALSKNDHPRVSGIIFTGFPLHPAGKPGTDRAGHLEAIKIPMLFLQGTRDSLADMKLIEKVCEKLPAATLVVFEGADHSFKSGKKDLIPDLAHAIVGWVTPIITRR